MIFGRHAIVQILKESGEKGGKTKGRDKANKKTHTHTHTHTHTRHRHTHTHTQTHTRTPIDNIPEWTGLTFSDALRKAENREEWRGMVPDKQ